MDITQLRMLREIDERGSIASVASAHLVTASAISQQLSALQSEFQVPLTEKRARRTVLTDAGRALVVAGLGIESSLAAARSAVDQFLEEPQGSVSVSAFHSAGLAWFGRLLDESIADLQLSDGDVSFDEFGQLTLDHDIVIAHRLAHGADWPRDRLFVVPLLEEPIGVAVSSSHPLASQRSVTPQQLVTEEWVSVHPGFPLSELLSTIAAAAGAPLRVKHRVNEFFVATALVRTGKAVALMPKHTMRGALSEGVTLLDIAGLPLARSIDALVQPQALHRRVVRDTLTLLQQIAASTTETGEASGSQLDSR